MTESITAQVWQEMNPERGTLADLMTEEIEPLRFVVDGLIPEVLMMLAGKPKIGKNRLMLTIALGACGGRQVLGPPTAPTEILYIALEDGKRRIQKQARELGVEHLDRDALARFNYRISWPTIDLGGLELLEEWMTDKPEKRLIVIDTWGKIQGRLEGKNRYQEELVRLGALQAFAIKYRIAMIPIHHLRKQGAEDWLEQISGSQAISGTNDTILGLFRKRGQMDATLRLVSREVEEKDLALRFEHGRWESMGDAAIYRQSVERTQVLETLETLGKASPSEIAPIVEKTAANVSKMLVALYEEGLVERVSRGVYSLSHLVVSVDSVEDTPLQSTQTTQSTHLEDQEGDSSACSECLMADGRHGSRCSQLPEPY